MLQRFMTSCSQFSALGSSSGLSPPWDQPMLPRARLEVESFGRWERGTGRHAIDVVSSCHNAFVSSVSQPHKSSPISALTESVLASYSPDPLTPSSRHSPMVKNSPDASDPSTTRYLATLRTTRFRPPCRCEHVPLPRGPSTSSWGGP
jgi:hypothetical protein